MAPSVRAEEREREKAEPRGQPEAQHPPLMLGLDLVIGFGQFPLLAPLRAVASFASLGNVSVSCESLLVIGSYALNEHLTLGVRVPMSLGSVPALDGSVTAFAFGNVELEAETELELSEAANLIFSLGVALPTAQGSEEPDTDSTGSVTKYHRFVLNRVANAARGGEDSALFEVDRLGIVPKVVLDYHAGSLLLTPFVKLENLISTRSGADPGYIVRLVLGTFVGYHGSENVAVGARVWLATSFEASGSTVGAVEPQLRAHFALVDVTLGGIIPFAGELTDLRFGGVRLAVSARL
jgi:hypothetical protein